ncbi:hypothetical protein J5226_13740 [Lysobacter sp. K5869]|uniref:hypothetical protein n=1 Tax=Lysobacter sp. K5869 TaxID=2820808 RepID=UPI001C05FFA5|nr:hypothetical protein [Lysobacter sp. K5869]QWP74729.1 hypothetical protein J5226_13740 [Lysobacter sp. K5869]
MRIDVFAAGDSAAYVVAPSDSWLPLDGMKALGTPRFGWAIDSTIGRPMLDWRVIGNDIDARGYSIAASTGSKAYWRCRSSICARFVASPSTT